MTTIAILHKLTSEQIQQVLEELPNSVIEAEVKKRSILRITDYEHSELIDELKDRGFGVVEKEELEELKDAVDIVNIVQSDMNALLVAIMTNHIGVQKAIIQKMINNFTDQQIQIK